MSMSVEQRRTEVLERQDFPAGSVRLTKASSRFDRRFRYFTVELLPARCVGTELEEHGWKVLANWPVADGRQAADVFFAGAWRTVQAQ